MTERSTPSAADRELREIAVRLLSQYRLTVEEVEAALREAQQLENEACSKIAKKMQFEAADVLEKGHDNDAAVRHDTAMEIADVIRARVAPSREEKKL